MSSSQFPASFVEPWKRLVQNRQDGCTDEFPQYNVTDLDSLITTSAPTSLFLGTGYSIYRQALIPAILSAKHSVHLVTCFWAESPTLDAIGEALLSLSNTRSQQNNLPPLRITVGFSSWGLFQKLLHTASTDGCVYPPSEWAKLGLPTEATLKRGSIDLTVKTLFFTPFSVMHPKYLIIDNTTAWVPSCNVSWEQWFEGCIELHGDAVQTLLNFHTKVWGRGDVQETRAKDDGIVPLALGFNSQAAMAHEQSQTASLMGDDGISAVQSAILKFGDQVPTILLPSSHHRNPRFKWIPGQPKCNLPPMTPLNAALLTLFANAQHWISIVTPNVTSRAVTDGLLAALGRGVDVEIRTSKNMMLMEQVVTAGTTTSWCLSSFIKQYQSLALERQRAQQSDPESQLAVVGELRVFYYQPLAGKAGDEDEPVFSHFKMTLVDGEYVVFGSGNMDRASWWTSQELGILFYVPGFTENELWERILKNRAEAVFISNNAR